MKHILKNMLCTSLLLLAVVGCGKEASKSSGAAAPVLSNPYLSGDANQILANIEGWYNTAETRQANYQIFKKVETFNTSQTCEKKEGWFGIKYEKCSFNGSALTSNEDQIFVSDFANTSKSANAELVNFINRDNGALQILSAVPYQSMYGQTYPSVYVVDMVKSPGIRVTYILDLNVHYQLNPVSKTEYSADGKSKTVTSLSSVRTK